MKRMTALAMCVSVVAWADSAAGLQWKVPEPWKADPARPMRVATYQIAAAKGDAEGAECAVFYFGQGQGGAVEANVQRWAGQFESAKPVTQKKEKIAKLDVTFVDLEGTYTGANGPMGPKSSKLGYRLAGAIVEGPQGPIFFKLVGPSKTVDAARADFQKLLKSIAP